MSETIYSLRRLVGAKSRYAGRDEPSSLDNAAGIQPRMRPATRTVRIIDSGTARRQHASKVLICQEFIGRFRVGFLSKRADRDGSSTKNLRRHSMPLIAPIDTNPHFRSSTGHAPDASPKPGMPVPAPAPGQCAERCGRPHANRPRPPKHRAAGCKSACSARHRRSAPKTSAPRLRNEGLAVALALRSTSNGAP